MPTAEQLTASVSPDSRWKALTKIVSRDGPGLDTPKRGVLQKGTVITVSEAQIGAAGAVRVKFVHVHGDAAEWSLPTSGRWR